MYRVILFFALFVVAALPSLSQDAEPPASADLPDNLVSYTVEPGDTLFRLARTRGISVDELRELNGLSPRDRLDAGMALLLPTVDAREFREYQVAWGDSLFEIAARFGTTEEALISLNAIADAADIRAGQILRIPHLPDAPPKPGFGFGITLFIDGGAADELAAQVADLGVNWIKIETPWSQLQPAPNRYDYEALDNLIIALDALGVMLLLNVFDAPDWSRESYRETMHSALLDYGGPPADSAVFAEFMENIAARYDSVVDAWEIWRAPNLLKYWTVPVYEQEQRKDEAGEYGLPDGMDMGAAQYVELLALAQAAVAAQDPEALIITAGLAPVGYTDNYNSIATDVFLDEMLSLGAADYADGIGAIFSASAVPPLLPCCLQPAGVETHYETFIQNFGALMAHYAEALAKHQVALPVWTTQVGWGSAEGENLAAPSTGYEWLTYTSLDEQALYVRQAYHLAQDLDALSAMFLYNLNGCAVADAEACFFSLHDAAGERRPAFEAYQEVPKAESASD